MQCVLQGEGGRAQGTGLQETLRSSRAMAWDWVLESPACGHAKNI